MEASDIKKMKDLEDENHRLKRKLYWPGVASKCNTYGSGVTFGRGYDMKHRSAGEIIADLTYVGIPLDEAKKIAGGA